MEQVKKIEQQIKRKQQVEQGAYDGRFKSRVISNKKKKANKRWARQKDT